MPVIYHIATTADWGAAQQTGEYEHPTLKAEGYIHCSLENQVAGVLERYFAGRTDLVKLSIDTDKLKSRYVFDWSQTNADTYPHVYGPINIDAVIHVEPISG